MDPSSRLIHITYTHRDSYNTLLSPVPQPVLPSPLLITHIPRHHGWICRRSHSSLVCKLSLLRMTLTMSQTTQLNSWHVSWHASSFRKIRRQFSSMTPQLYTASTSHCLDTHIPIDNGQGRYFRLLAGYLHKGLKRSAHGYRLTTQHTTLNPPFTTIVYPNS